MSMPLHLGYVILLKFLEPWNMGNDLAVRHLKEISSTESQK
jgi:secreted trypsin-like serine protease